MFGFDDPQRFDDPTVEPSVVTFEIEPDLDIIKLTLTYTSLASMDDLHACGQGWPAVLANLKTLLETGDVLPQEPWQFHAEDRAAQRQGTDRPGWLPHREAHDSGSRGLGQSFDDELNLPAGVGRSQRTGAQEQAVADRGVGELDHVTDARCGSGTPVPAGVREVFSRLEPCRSPARSAERGGRQRPDEQGSPAEMWAPGR